MLALVDPSDLPDRLARAGRKQSDLARHLRLDPSSLTKTIKGQRQLKAHELLAIEEFFDGSGDGAVESLSARRGAKPRRIPIYGYAAAGGEEVVAFGAGQVIDYVEPPPLWNGVGDLVAIRVIGDSMEPRLFQGEMVIAQLDLPPLRGSDCVIEMNDGTALVKTYRGTSEWTVTAHQYNPDKDIKVDRERVKGLHSVVWRR